MAPRAVRALARQYQQNADLVWLFVIAGVACFLFAALFTPDPLITHEGFETYFRTQQYLQEFGNGHWIPQVLPDAVRGAGAAFPSFYPPVAYLITSMLAFLSRDVVRGVNVALLLSTIVSGWSMYFMVVSMTRDRLAAGVAALMYLTFPYRFVDVFVRGALAESWSFVWFPLIVAGTWRAFTDRRLPWILPVAWAALLLTHVPTAMYFTIPYAALLLIGFWREGWRVAAALASAFVLALGLGAWFVAPQQAMLGDVRASDPVTFHADADFVHSGRVSGRQLAGTWRNAWRGPDHDLILENGERCPRFYCLRTYVLGTGHVVMLLLAGAVVTSVVVARSRSRPVDPWPRRLLFAVGALFAAYVFNVAFMVSPKPFLRLLPASFSYIQYPWRLVGLAAFLAATIIGLLLSSMLLPRRVTHAALAVSAVLVLAVPSVQRSPAVERDVDEQDLEALLPARGDRGFTTEGEYLPREMNPDDIGPHLIDAPIVRGNGEVVDWTRDEGDVEASVVVRDDSTIVFPLLYYDIYRVTASGGDGRVDTFSADGLLAARIPSGTTSVRVTHGLTDVGWLGLAISVISACALAAIVLQRHRRKPDALAPHDHLDDADLRQPAAQR